MTWLAFTQLNMALWTSCSTPLMLHRSSLKPSIQLATILTMSIWELKDTMDSHLDSSCHPAENI
jgi:hypothetical protein